MSGIVINKLPPPPTCSLSTSYVDNFNLKLRNGDEAAYKSLYVRIYPRMVSYANLFVKDSELARDIAQDTFIGFWEKREHLNEYPPAEGLLFAMLKNNCLKFIRDNKFFQATVPLNRDNMEEIPYLFQSDFFHQEEEVEDVFWEILLNGINKLPKKRKEVFEKCKLHGQPQKEVACELGISLKAVEKHLSYAKKQLQEFVSVHVSDSSIL